MPEGLSTLEVKASRGQRCCGSGHTSAKIKAVVQERAGQARLRTGRKSLTQPHRFPWGLLVKTVNAGCWGHAVSSVKTEEPDDPEDQHRRSGTGPSAGAWSVFLEVKLRLLGAGMALRRM